jgi:hypothetical protein
MNHIGVRWTAEQDGITPLDTGGDNRFGSGPGEIYGSAHDHHRDQRSAANVNRFEIEAMLGE